MASISEGNHYMLLVETRYGTLRSLILMVDALMVVGYGWLVRRIQMLSAGTHADRYDEATTDIEQAVEALLAQSIDPGYAILA